MLWARCRTLILVFSKISKNFFTILGFFALGAWYLLLGRASWVLELVAALVKVLLGRRDQKVGFFYLLVGYTTVDESMGT